MKGRNVLKMQEFAQEIVEIHICKKRAFHLIKDSLLSSDSGTERFFSKMDIER